MCYFFKTLELHVSCLEAKNKKASEIGLLNESVGFQNFARLTTTNTPNYIVGYFITKCAFKITEACPNKTQL